MNIKVIVFLLGRISGGIGLALAVPLLMALYYGEASYKEILMSIGVSGYLCFLFGQYGYDADKRDISVREGIGTVFLTWVLVCILSALPFLFGGYTDICGALFESMSGLTTTGATVFTDLEVIPKSILFWRSMTHWLGGIGIVVLFVALLPQMAGGAVYLFNAEASGFTNSRILPRIRTTAVALFYIYCLLTIILIGLLVMLGMSEYDAVNHAFSAVATGGFSTYNSSVGHFNSVAIEVVLGVFMILSAGNFALYYHVSQSGIRVLWRDGEFRAYLCLIAILTLLITANIVYVNGYSVGEGLRYAFFQVASFGSTTGYVSYDYDQWPSFAKLLLAVTMFTGGCAGSTAGGIKICRFLVLLKTVAAELRRTLHPQMLLTVYYNNKILPIPTLINIGRFFFIYIFTLVVLSFALSATGMSVEESIFGVATCMSSVGPAFGSTTGYVSYDYDQWPSFAKLLLAVTMFTGGCAGSTAGGIKICRFLVLLKTVAAELRRTLHPQMLLTVYYNNKILPIPTLINIGRFFFLYIFTLVVLSFALSATGMSVEESIFGVATCMSSVGPAFGSIGATGNYAGVSSIGKLILCVAMLLGRLELFTALSLLRSEYWRPSKRW